MGRAFEFRKVRKMKRWDKMSKAFTKIGKEIAIAVRLGGPDPAGNPRLRSAIQNAKGVNMPKDRVEGAIKRASSKDAENFEEAVYEGYGPHGVAIIIETATNNPTRTVANIRSYFSKFGGALGNTGSLSFMFDRKGVFRLPATGLDKDTLELELIDHGAEDIKIEDEEMVVYTSFADFAGMQKALEEKGIAVTEANIERLATTTKELTEEQATEVFDLIERIEEDDDVQAVYHTVA
ncbi:MAG TPA: YebC/PmpR family DNA-binding transcriptional regulator [Candidatus Kapabacteria bacterium]|nr:YebC/PmpR family DNA-binding transcriptional regulator [Candidatus Kapabacteria bacterium]